MAVKPRPKNLRRQPVNLIASAVNKPRQVDKAFAAKIDPLYNRLQDAGKAFDAFKDLSKHLNFSFSHPRDMLHVAADLMLRCDTTVTTLQMNRDADHTNYQVVMSYQDRTKKPIYGFYYPALTAVITSPSLALAVTLAYLTVSKQAGRFV